MVVSQRRGREHTVRTFQKECPVIGGTAVSTVVSDRDVEFQALWKHYEPKVRKMSKQFAVDGAVGAEQDDLVQIAQAMLLHTLRKHDPSKARFSTYYYTCLRNEYFHLLKRCYPKKRYLIVSFNAATGSREILKCTGGELEAVLMTLRAAGCAYSVVPKDNSTRYPLMENLESIDKAFVPAGQADDEAESHSHDVFASPEEPLTVDEIMERIRHRIPDQQLQNIAIWLFEGHKMTGADGIMKRTGLRKHQVERAMHQIRMLLRGEFGIHDSNRAAAHGRVHPLASQDEENPVASADVELKVCRRCKEQKPISLFGRCAGHVSALLSVKSYCLDCEGKRLAK